MENSFDVFVCYTFNFPKIIIIHLIYAKADIPMKMIKYAVCMPNKI